MPPAPAPFLVTDDSRLECKATGGAILWLYRDAVSSYGAIGHGLDHEAVGYRRFFGARAADRSDRPLAGTDDLGLHDLADPLRRGALVALCCEVHDLLDEELPSAETRAFLTAWSGVAEPAVPPLTRECIEAALPALDAPPDAAWELTPVGARLRRVMDAVYRQHVAGFLRELAARAAAP